MDNIAVPFIELKLALEQYAVPFINCLSVKICLKCHNKLFSNLYTYYNDDFKLYHSQYMGFTIHVSNSDNCLMCCYSKKKEIYG